MSAQTRMVHTGPGHWSPQTTIVSDSQMARRAREEHLRRARGEGAASSTGSGAAGAFLVAVVLVGVFHDYIDAAMQFLEHAWNMIGR